MVSRTMVRFYLTFLVATSFIACTKAQEIEEANLRESIEVTTPIFVVQYSETKEQPLSLTYQSTNRPKNADRGSLNFRKEKDYHTSDNADYYSNVWDKGHLAPAATFSDSMENIKLTFSFLNCALQNKYLNRGQWRLLEEQERRWDDEQNLEVRIDIKFSDSILPTGATIPSRFIKHIKFLNDNVYKCYDFPNERPELDWEEYQIEHQH